MTEVWDKKNPKKEHKKLDSDQKSNAKARAKAAGRPYLNLVDNMAASKNEETIATIKRVIRESFNNKYS